MSSQGTFVPQPRHDILVEAIKTYEHGSRARSVGEDIGMGLWFGTSRKSTCMKKKEMDEIVEKKLPSESQSQKNVLVDLNAFTIRSWKIR